MSTSWTMFLPERLGDMPLGGDLLRTDPAGPRDARIAILGVYPAATAWKHPIINGRRRKLPVAVERTSFEPASSSGSSLETRYLNPLRLQRASVLLVDMWPYFMANTRGERGRTMADNIREYETATGHKTQVEQRPDADLLLSRVRTSGPNQERLREVLGSPNLRLLLTLGNEPAALVRGLARAAAAQPLLYGSPADLRLDWLARSVTTVHLTHPGNVFGELTTRHREWCIGEGSRILSEVFQD